MGNKVLVVEDIKYLRESIILYLKNEGFEILEAEDGETGLQIALKEKPEIIVSNIEMPVMDAFGMMEELRINDAKIPIILITGHHSQEIREKSKLCGAEAYFEKPFNIEELVEEVKSIIKKSEK